MALKTKCPFKLDLQVPDQNYIGELDVCIVKSKQPKTDILTRKPHTLEAAIDMLKIFAMAVNEQMFAYAADKADYAQMTFLDETEDPLTRMVHYRYGVAKIPPQAYFYLVALISQAYYVDEPIDALLITPLSKTDEIIETQSWLSLSRSFPAKVSPDFLVKIDENVVDADRFDVTLEFVEPVSAELMEIIHDALSVWDEMRIIGGFLLDCKEIEAPGNPGGIVQDSPAVVTLEVDDYFDGETSAFNCIVNFAARLHSQGLHLKSVAIEQTFDNGD